MRLRATIAAAIPLLLALAGPVRADPQADELAAALQRRYDRVRDFSADFVHSYRGGVLNKQITEKGHLLVKKPGKMRWSYTSPEEKLFVSDGVTLSAYVPQDKQVTVTAVPSEDRATTPALFLTGKGNLTRDFVASLTSLPAGAPPGARALKLVPRTAQPDYDWLILAVQAGTLDLRGLVTTDTQGGTSTFSFTNLKENVGLSDTEFMFTVPRGVDVVTDGPRR